MHLLPPPLPQPSSPLPASSTHPFHNPPSPTFPPTPSFRKRGREFAYQDDYHRNRSCRRSVFSYRSYPPNKEWRNSRSGRRISNHTFPHRKPQLQISRESCVPTIHHLRHPSTQLTISKACSTSVATAPNGTAICNRDTHSAADKQSYPEVGSNDQPTLTPQVREMLNVETGHSQAMPEEEKPTNTENDHTTKSCEQQGFCEVAGREILDSLDLGDISHLEEDFKLLITEQNQDQYRGSISDDDLELGSTAIDAVLASPIAERSKPTTENSPIDVVIPPSGGSSPIVETSKPTEDPRRIDVVIPPSGGSSPIASDSPSSIGGCTRTPSKVSGQTQRNGKRQPSLASPGLSVTTGSSIHKTPLHGNTARGRECGEKDDCPPVKDFSDKFKLHGRPVLKEIQYETDAHRISQRQRQIQFGKNTLGYERYIELVPRYKRKKSDPHTPEVRQACSKRSWDGQIKKWRRLLHFYDPPMEEDDEMPVDFSKNELEEGTNEAKLPDESQTTEVQAKIESSIYGDWDEMEI